MKFSVFQISRRGGREKNEDRMGYCYTRAACLFVLADGMGGHPQGELAAQIAVQTVSALFQRQARPALADVQAFLSSALLAAHQQILRHGNQHGLLDSPRTTLVLAVVQDGIARWIHCGDSRLYLVRHGEVRVRTRDHSYIELRNAAIPGLERVNRNVLFTCLGSTVRPMFDVAGPLRLLEGDRVLLCSDGLWGSLADELIVSTLGTLPVAKAVPTLVDAALQAAGEHSDNVTVLAIEWESPADAAFEHSGFTETQVLSDEVFASTIQAGAYDPLLDDLDDEAIERSIAEINAAIQRTAMNRR